MDQAVLYAMRRWPAVPEVYGWLGLDRRGRWRLRGEPIAHPGTLAFIGRNYAADARGCWYFQNGPQRVYVELEYTPWVYALEPDGTLRTHTGVPAGTPRRLWLDEAGQLLLCAAPGAGLLAPADLASVAERLRTREGAPLDAESLEQALGAEQTDQALCWIDWWGERHAVHRLHSSEAPARLGFVRIPRAPA